MRILHTSDWHLGMSVGTGTLAGDQRFFLEQLYSIIEEEQAEHAQEREEDIGDGAARAQPSGRMMLHHLILPPFLSTGSSVLVTTTQSTAQMRNSTVETAPARP